MLEELQKDPWPVPADQRSTRCTSTALSVAASLLGACVPGSGARIMAFVGGPSTEGPGAVSISSFALLFSGMITFSLSCCAFQQFSFILCIVLEIDSSSLH